MGDRAHSEHPFPGAGGLGLLITPADTHPAPQKHLGAPPAGPLGGQQERRLGAPFAFLLWRKPHARPRRGLGVRDKGGKLGRSSSGQPGARAGVGA